MFNEMLAMAMQESKVGAKQEAALRETVELAADMEGALQDIKREQVGLMIDGSAKHWHCKCVALGSRKGHLCGSGMRCWVWGPWSACRGRARWQRRRGWLKGKCSATSIWVGPHIKHCLSKGSVRRQMRQGFA